MRECKLLVLDSTRLVKRARLTGGRDFYAVAVVAGDGSLKIVGSFYVRRNSAEYINAALTAMLQHVDSDGTNHRPLAVYVDDNDAGTVQVLTSVLAHLYPHRLLLVF